jgi:hypothetical protein
MFCRSDFFCSSLIFLCRPAFKSFETRTEERADGGALIFDFFFISSPILALCFAEGVYFEAWRLSKTFSLLLFSNVCFLTFIIINNKNTIFLIHTSESSSTYRPFSNFSIHVSLPFLIVISPCLSPFKYVPD